MIINFRLLNSIKDFNKLPGFEVVNNILFKLFDKLFSLSVKNIPINPCIISIIARLWIKIILIFSGHFWLCNNGLLINQIV